MQTPVNKDRPHRKNLAAHGWVPDQHGAWPMALVPLLMGTLFAPAKPLHLLLALAWTSAFFLFNAVEVWARTTKKRKPRLHPALFTWTALATTSGTALLALDPYLLRWAPAFLPLVALASFQLLKGRPRALTTRATTILASCLMTPVAFALGSGHRPASTELLAHWGIATGNPTWAQVWFTAAALAAYFLGTVPYVRSLIRGRGENKWAIGAGMWHLTSAIALTIGASTFGNAVPTALLWACLSVRAIAVPLFLRRTGPLKPVWIGLSEMALTAALVAILLLL